MLWTSAEYEGRKPRARGRINLIANIWSKDMYGSDDANRMCQLFHQFYTLLTSKISLAFPTNANKSSVIKLFSRDICISQMIFFNSCSGMHQIWTVLKNVTKFSGKNIPLVKSFFYLRFFMRILHNSSMVLLCTASAVYLGHHLTIYEICN